MLKSKPDRDAELKDKVQATPSDEPQPEPARLPDEWNLFRGASSPRLIGDGDPNEIGSHEVHAAHAHAGLGSFSDAGGFGGTELLGEEGAQEYASEDSEPGDEQPSTGEKSDQS